MLPNFHLPRLIRWSLKYRCPQNCLCFHSSHSHQTYQSTLMSQMLQRPLMSPWNLMLRYRR